MRLVADAQILRGDDNAAGDQLVDLFEERFGVEHDTVADEAHDTGAKDADGEEVGRILFAVDFDGMAGIGAATVTNDHFGMFREEIDDLAFTFISPLKPKHTGVALQKRTHAGTAFRT